MLSVELRSKTWLMYLRKSRQDDPDETVEEVLAKHESMLQEWAMRELGREIPEDCIYREVVSGESIADRVKIQKVLARIEDPNVAGVLCRDPQRLGRPDLTDCGTLINTFMYTRTLVATMMMTYDLTNKMERRFFQDELMRGRDYLDYVKEVLAAGRIASAKRGNYIPSKTIFGYDKVKIGKDHTLVPNKNADVVRMIFDWYVNEGIGYQVIANRLDAMGVRPPNTDMWVKNTIAGILRNPHYIGKVRYNYRKMETVVEGGQRKLRRVRTSEDEAIFAEGKHPAIIDLATFEAAQKRMNNNPRVTSQKELRNAMAGIIVCADCKRHLQYNGYGGTRSPRLGCVKKPKHFKSAKYSEVEAAVIVALEQSELPNLEAMRKNNAGTSAAIQQQIIKNLEDEMQGYREQEEMQYELLETRRYTQELFDKRNAALRQKMTECEERIKKARKALPDAVDYEEKVSQLKTAIAALKDGSMSTEQKNKLLKVIVDRIELATADGGWNTTEIRLRIFLRI